MKFSFPNFWAHHCLVLVRGGGGTDPGRGYGDVRPWRPPFHASPATRKGPISSKRVSSQDPLLRKFGNFGLYSLNFHPNFSSQAPNLEIFSSQAPKFRNFQLTSPQIWKFSAHKTPFSEANVSSQAPHFRNPGRTPLPEKKLSAPPPGVLVVIAPGSLPYYYCLKCKSYIQALLTFQPTPSWLLFSKVAFWCISVCEWINLTWICHSAILSVRLTVCSF